jgi:hypothetical protein
MFGASSHRVLLGHPRFTSRLDRDNQAVYEEPVWRNLPAARLIGEIAV